MTEVNVMRAIESQFMETFCLPAQMPSYPEIKLLIMSIETTFSIFPHCLTEKP